MFTRTEKILAATALLLLFACVCLAFPRPPQKAAWYECGTTSGGTKILVGHPRCCVADATIVEGCDVMMAAKVK